MIIRTGSCLSSALVTMTKAKLMSQYYCCCCCCSFSTLITSSTRRHRITMVEYCAHLWVKQWTKRRRTSGSNSWLSVSFRQKHSVWRLLVDSSSSPSTWPPPAAAEAALSSSLLPKAHQTTFTQLIDTIPANAATAVVVVHSWIVNKAPTAPVIHLHLLL